MFKIFKMVSRVVIPKATKVSIMHRSISLGSCLVLPRAAHRYYDHWSKMGIFKRFYGQWDRSELPIMPRISFAHRNLKQALNNCRDKIPSDFAAQMEGALDRVRAHNWHFYNCAYGPDGHIAKAKEDLQALYDLKAKLPEAFHIFLKNQGVSAETVFEGILEAQECLIDRMIGGSLGRARNNISVW